MTPTDEEIRAAEQWDAEHPPVPFWYGCYQPSERDRVRRRIYQARAEKQMCPST